LIAAVVLAAGASTRLGHPKQLVELAGERLLERAVRTAREAGCSPVVVVLGAAYEDILGRSQLGDAVPVINAEWAEGMASSIRFGVRTLGFVAKDAQGAVLLACDQPAVTPAHLRALMASGEVTASAYAERRGVPAYFPASAFAVLMELRGDQGARELLHDAKAIDLPSGETDIDTLADVAAAERLFGGP
jgi:CTP:molybdopterin cytidylyltransferase MocA